MDAQERLSLLEDAALAGGEVALDSFRTEFDVETKDGPLDTVTRIDRDVQSRVIDHVQSAHPDAVVVGEEDVESAEVRKRVPEEGAAWVVDPIDGTNNYVAGNRTWAVALAATVDGEPEVGVVHMPARGDTYRAADGPVRRNGTEVSVSPKTDPETFLVDPVFGLAGPHRRGLVQSVEAVVDGFGDVRKYGCAQSSLAGVASGELDAAVSTVRLNPWDTVAGVHLVRRAGGTVTDVEGARWRHDSTGLVASNGEAHDELVAALSATE